VPWRTHSLFEPLFADAEIRIGDDQFSPLQVSPLSSNNKFNDWDSRRKRVQILVPYDTRASVTAIDAMCRNGCWVRGGSMWTRL
jgi:hypothetical protein